MAQIKLPHSAITKSPSLLPMMYTIRELGDELNTDIKTIKSWVKAGLPHERDSRNHIYIYGQGLAEWIAEKKEQKNRNKSILHPDEAYCLACRKPVIIHQPRFSQKDISPLIKGTCPNCGNRINKGIKYDQPN